MTTPDSPDLPGSHASGRTDAPAGPPGNRPGADATADELVADIEATRAELGETAAALSERFDLKAQARNSVDEAKHHAGASVRTARARATGLVDQAKDRATDDHGNLDGRSGPVVAAGVVIVVAVIAGLLRRRARR